MIRINKNMLKNTLSNMINQSNMLTLMVYSKRIRFNYLSPIINAYFTTSECLI